MEELGYNCYIQAYHAATFVNAEETEYLVIEDDFPKWTTRYGKGGIIIFTNRETVDRGNLRLILSNKKIFGVDLYEIGMADSICEYF